MPGNVGFWVLAFIVHWGVAAGFLSLYKKDLTATGMGIVTSSVYSVSSSSKKIDISLESGLNLSQVSNHGHNPSSVFSSCLLLCVVSWSNTSTVTVKSSCVCS